MAHNPIRKKIERLKEGAAPRVADLFSGCGGISLGFKAAGFEVVAGVESDPLAAESHADSFHRALSDSVKQLHAQARDIVDLEPGELVKELKLGARTMAVDILVGGPPCQAFARVGRAKLREVAAHPRAFQQDPRGNLYLRYLHYVKELRPLAILIENVPDALNYGGHNIAEEISEVLDAAGYSCAYTLLNAAYYGVPQMRERMFLLAYVRELKVAPVFPEPSHWIDLPEGYKGSRSVALKSVVDDLFKKGYYLPPPSASTDLRQAVTAQEAIGDLPPITLHLENKLRRGARRFDDPIPYGAPSSLTAYAALMRSWPGFEGRDTIADHVIRYLPRDYPIFRRMNPGDQYPEAYEHARDLFREEVERRRRDGEELDKGAAGYESLQKGMVPGYDPGKFPNKWRKLEPDRPARTLMAHLGKDGYSHIHYDGSQARTISVREAARLQSFPDGFAFAGTMNPAFRQIGNAVPPLLAYVIAKKVRKALGGPGRKNTRLEAFYERG